MSVVDSILSDCSSVHQKKAAVHIVEHFESVLLSEPQQLSLQSLQYHQLGYCRQLLSQEGRMKSSVLSW